MNTKYKSNNNIVYSCKYHIVWCLKYRRKVLVGQIEIRLRELIAQICHEVQADLIEFEIMPDHVHLLVEIDPQYGVHKLVKTLKGKTPRILRGGISSLDNQASDIVDKFIFCVNCRWCAYVNHQAIH